MLEESTTNRGFGTLCYVSDTKWLNNTEAVAWRGLLAVMHRASAEIERDLQAHGLLGVHYHIFATLSASPEHTMRLSDLADSANVSQSRLTHRMRGLVDQGYVEIDRDPEDGRAKLATLTDAGRARLAEVAPHHVATVRRLIFDQLTESQTKALASALSPIADALCDHPEYLNPRS